MSKRIIKNENRGFKGIWIPKDLWLNKDLTVMEMLFLAEIDSLEQDEQGCFASNNHFSEFFGISRSRSSQIITKLIKKGFITATYDRTETKQITKRHLWVVNKLTTPSKYSKQGYLENCEGSNTSISNTKNSRRKAKKPVYDESSDYMKLARYLQKQILLNKPDFKKPNLQTWADYFRKLVELDHRDKHQVALVIKWCQHDSFWSTNILSARSLRDQYDRLSLKMQASKGSNPEPRVSKHDDQIKKARREREKFVLYKYSEVGNDLDKALPLIQAKYPEIDSKDKVLRILYPERYLMAGGVENGY